MRKDVESALSKASLGAVILLFAGAAFFLFTLWRWGRFVTSTIRYVVENLASHSGISTNLLYGLVVIGTIPFFWAVAKYMHGAWFWLRGLGPGLRLYKSIHGMIIVTYVGLYFLAMFFVARNSIAYKYCAQTPEGLKVFDDRVKDPVWGIQAEPCTTQQIVDYERTKNPDFGPKRVQVADAHAFPFFDKVTGNPSFWYFKTSAGDYEVFDQMGNDPKTGTPLKPVDHQVREDMIRLQDLRSVAEKERNRAAVEDKYINTGVQKHSGNRQAAILLFSDGKGSFTGIEDILGQAVSNRGIIPVESFFKPEFVQEGRAQRLFAGDWGDAAQLGLGSRVDVIILGHASFASGESSQFEGLVSTNLTLELKCLNPGRQTICGVRTIDTVGAGYSKDESLKSAADKARSEIAAFAAALSIN
jgi:hypothetical protein